MALVRIYNDNSIEHVESFKGNSYKIAPGGYVEMDSEDAVLFLGQFRAIKKDKSGIQTKESMKSLSIKQINRNEVVQKEAEGHICHKCGFAAQSKAGLLAHVRANHVESMVDDDAKKEIQRGG